MFRVSNVDATLQQVQALTSSLQGADTGLQLTFVVVQRCAYDVWSLKVQCLIRYHHGDMNTQLPTLRRADERDSLGVLRAICHEVAQQVLAESRRLSDLDHHRFRRRRLEQPEHVDAQPLRTREESIIGVMHGCQRNFPSVRMLQCANLPRQTRRLQVRNAMLQACRNLLHPQCAPHCHGTANNTSASADAMPDACGGNASSQ